MPTSPTSPAPWLAELRAHPTRHGLLAAFDLLARATGDMAQSTGRSTVRFTHSTALGLPLAEVLAVDVDPNDPTRHRVTTAGAGPLGPASPLPLALADALDTAAGHAVLDPFHHRRTLLLCRGLLAADLAATLSGDDDWSRRTIALTGLMGLTGSVAAPLTVLRLAPIFVAPDRSTRALAVALRRLLPALFGPATTLRCEPMPGRPTPLAEGLQSRLGRPAARLGDTAALGVAVRLPGSAARLIAGPLPAAALVALRPGGAAHEPLRALLLAFIPEPLELELVLELADVSAPPARLGQRRIGRDLWLTPTRHDRAPRRVTVPLTPRPG